MAGKKQVCHLRELENEERKNDDVYGNCDFLVGSIPEVESLWSIAKLILAAHHRSNTPQLFETCCCSRSIGAFEMLELIQRLSSKASHKVNIVEEM